MIIHQFIKENTFGDKVVCEKTIEGKGSYACVEYKDRWYEFYYFVKAFQGWTVLMGVITHSKENAIEEFEKFVEDCSNDPGIEKYYKELKEIRNEKE